MAKPEVHGNPPDGVNAGAALGDDSQVEDAKVKEIRDAGGGKSQNAARGNSSDGGSPAWMGVVEDLLRVGGKELFHTAKDYVREGNLNLFTRRNPSPDDSQTGEEARKNAPQIPPEEHFKTEPDSGGSSDGQSQGKSRTNESGYKGDSENQVPPPTPRSTGGSSLSPGDLARVEVGNSVVWVKVTGTAEGADDYEGRLAASALGLAENSPVTFSNRHLLGRVGEAPTDPTPGPPEGIAGKRTRDNPGRNDGPLPPRF